MAHLPESIQDNENNPGTYSIGTRVYAGREGVTWLLAIPHETIPNQRHKSLHIAQGWNLFFIGLNLHGLECRSRTGFGRDFRADFPPEFEMGDDFPVMQAHTPFPQNQRVIFSALAQMPQIAEAMQADPDTNPIVPRVFSHLIEMTNRTLLQQIIQKRAVIATRGRDNEPLCITYLIPRSPDTFSIMAGSLTEDTLANISRGTPLVLSTSTRVRRPDEFSSGTGITIKHAYASPHDTPGEFAQYLLDDLPYLIEGTDHAHHPFLEPTQLWMLQIPVRSALVHSIDYLESLARQ